MKIYGILIVLLITIQNAFSFVTTDAILEIIATQKQKYSTRYCLCHHKVMPEEFDGSQIGRNSEVGNAFFNQVIYESTEESENCVRKVEEVAKNSDVGTFETKLQNALLGERIAEDPQGIICTSLEIAEKRKEYKNKMNDGMKFFRGLIETTICNNEVNPIENIRPTERKCRKELLNLVVEFEDVAEDYCDIPPDLSVQGKVQNECIEKESYRYILSEGVDDFISIKCKGEVDSAFDASGKAKEGQEYMRFRFDCERDMKAIIAKSLYPKDYERCEDEKNFNKETKSPIVCSNIILSPQLSFLTDVEEEALAECIKNLTPANVEEIKRCVYTMFDKNEDLCFDKLVDNEDTLKKLLPKDSPQLKPGMCISEKDLLEQMKNRYCPARLFQTTSEMETCIQMIVDQGLRIFRVSPEELRMCEEIAQKEATDELKEFAKKKCLRTVMYSKMLENNLLEVARCWNKAEYPTLKDRRKCNEQAQEFYRMLSGCERMTEPANVKACLSSLYPPEFLRNYLESKAVKFGVNVQDCVIDSPNYLQCMMSKLYPSAEDYNLLRTNLQSACAIGGEAIMAECQTAFNQLDQAPMDGQELSAKYYEDMDKKVSDIVSGTADLPDTDPDNIASIGTTTGGYDANLSTLDGEKTVAINGYNSPNGVVSSNPMIAGTGGVVVAATTVGGARNQLQNFNQVASSNYDDNEGMFASFKNMKFRKHPDHLCQQIGKGAMLRVVGTVGGIVTTAVVHASVMKKFKEENENVGGFDHLKQAWKGALAGIGVKLAFNTMARLIYKDTEAKAATVTTTSGDIPRCRYADIPTGDDVEASLSTYDIYKTYVINNRPTSEMIYMFDTNLKSFSKTFETDEMTLLLASIDNKLSDDKNGIDSETKSEIRKVMAEVLNKIVFAETAYAADDSAQKLQMVMGFAPMFFSMMNSSKEEEKYEKEKGYVEVLPEASAAGGDVDMAIGNLNNTVIPQMTNNISTIEQVEEKSEE